MSDRNERPSGAQVAASAKEATEPEQVRPGTVGPKSRKMSAERIEAAAVAACIVHSACDSSSTSVPSLALALGVSRQRADQWVAPEGDASLTLRDLIAARRQKPGFYAEVVRQLSELDAPAPPSRLPHAIHACRVSAEAGDVARVMACPEATTERKRRELLETIDACRRALVDLDAEERGR